MTHVRQVLNNWGVKKGLASHPKKLKMPALFKKVERNYDVTIALCDFTEEPFDFDLDNTVVEYLPLQTLLLK